METRKQWVALLWQIAQPVLKSFSDETFFEQAPCPINVPERKAGMALEALARVLCGISPFLESNGGDADERAIRNSLRTLAVKALRNAVNPASPVHCVFTDKTQFGRAVSAQALVDAAMLCQAIAQAPCQLWESADAKTKQNLIQGLLCARKIKPYRSNWLLFSAMIELGLSMMGQEADMTHVDYALFQLEQWYQGDGVYSDGEWLTLDYYNSIIIHPMLLMVCKYFKQYYVLEEDGNGEQMYERYLARAQRAAVVLERIIAPDGSYPVLGRSIAYRAGVFHLLAYLALTQQLPQALSPAQVRIALDKVIRKTLTGRENYTKNGFLKVGLCGNQPSCGEFYINTGSLYLCTFAFLPLGLSPECDFWSGADCTSTWERIWGGKDFLADHALDLLPENEDPKTR